MQNDSSSGGDGVTMGPTGEAPVATPPPIQGEVSETQEQLEAKIEQELGLPHVPSKETNADTTTEDSSDESTDDTTESAESGDDADQGEQDSAEDTQEVEQVAATPSDEELFIEVEDAEGVTHKISKIEDLPEDFSPKNNRQIIEIVSQLGKLEAQMEQREADRATAAAKAEQEAAQQAQFTAWDKEIAELGKEKRLDANDTDKISKVFEHIAEINDKRAKAGNPNLITSFEDGLDKYEAAQAKTAAADKAKQENDRAKAKASLIGGGNSTGGSTPQPYYSGRYRSMDDVPV